MRFFLVFLTVVLFYSPLNAQSKTFNIGFLLDNSTEEINILLNKLEEEINAVVGEDAIVQFSENNRLSNNFSKTKARTNYDTFLKGNIDIIIAFGIVNASLLEEYDSFSKPTILFGALSEEFIKTKQDKSGIPNYTSIVTNQSYKEDLQALQELTQAKTIGVVVESSFAENMPIARVLGDLESELELKLPIIPFKTYQDIISNLEAIDAVYLAGGFYLSEQDITKLAQFLIDKKIPSITSTPVKDVELGIMATNHEQSEVNQFFRRIALTVETVVNNGDLSETSTIIETNRALTINFNTVDQIGLPLKYSVLIKSNLIGNTKDLVSEKKYDLIQVMEEAIAENLQLETFRQNVLINDKEVQFANSDYLPNVIAGANGNYIDPELAKASSGRNPEMSTSANITLSQTVFSEAVNANISIQKALRDAQQENYASEELNTVFNSATAYFTALILKANLTIQKQNLDLTKYNLKIATENYEAGQAGKADVLRFKSEVAQNTQDLIEALNQLNQGYFTLNQLLNNPIETKIDVDEAELNEGVFQNYNYEGLGAFLDDPRLRKSFVSFLVQEAMKNAPELKALEYNLNATERSERLFGAGRFLPTLALQGQYFYQFSRTGVGSEFPPLFPVIPMDYYTVGLNLSLPIFNQNKQNINKQIASIQKEQLLVTQSNLMLSIEKNINDAVLELVNQVSNIELSKVFENTAKEALELTQTSYASGAVNIVQLLDAQNNYLQAQLASTNATYNYLLSSMKLERFLGTFFLLQTEDERNEFMQRFLEFNQSNDD